MHSTGHREFLLHPATLKSEWPVTDPQGTLSRGQPDLRPRLFSTQHILRGSPGGWGFPLCLLVSGPFPVCAF